jgi:hypothetical protein
MAAKRGSCARLGWLGLGRPARYAARGHGCRLVGLAAGGDRPAQAMGQKRLSFAV